MYFNTIDKKRKDILIKIVKGISLTKYYMAGGTALSLQCGNRISYDFDFFVYEKFKAEELSSELEKLGKFNIVYSKEGTLHGILDGVQVTFLYYPNPLIYPLVKSEEIDGLYYASLFDIAIMKIVAISSRGSKKDFFDLYFLSKFKKIDIKEVFLSLDKKYLKRNIPSIHIIQSLTYFDDADQQAGLELLVDMKWDEVKEFFVVEQKKLFEVYNDIEN